MQAHGWLTEAEQAALVAQHLATAAAGADQAQIFCAVDFPDELQWRRGLVSSRFNRRRPALRSFQFMQLWQLSQGRPKRHGRESDG